MTTYRLINDIFTCHEAFVDFKALRRQFNDVKVWFPQENTSLLDKLKAEWTPVDVKFESDRKKNLLPDLSVWNLSCLVLSSKAYAALKDFLDPIGEFLALNEGFYLFNCLDTVAADSIDTTKTKIQIDNIDSNHIPKALAFLPDKIAGKFLFKPSFLENSFLICQDELKNIATEQNLAGLIFEEDLAQIFPRKV